DSRVIQAFRTFLARFGSLDQLYIVFTAPEGQPIADYADDIGEWTDALRAAPEIARVDSGIIDRTRDFGWLADHQLLLLHGRALRVARGPPAAAAARPRARPGAGGAAAGRQDAGAPRPPRSADGAVCRRGATGPPGSARAPRPHARRARRLERRHQPRRQRRR